MATVLAALLFVCCVIGTLARLEITDDCINEAGATREIVEKLFQPGTAETDDRNLRCFFKCEMLRQQFINANGEIMSPPADKAHPQLLSVFDTCRPKVTGTDLCERAYSFHVCAVASHVA